MGVIITQCSQRRREVQKIIAIATAGAFGGGDLAGDFDIVGRAEESGVVFGGNIHQAVFAGAISKLGTSAGTPTRSRNVTALALSHSGHKPWYLVDCGKGTQHQLLRAHYSVMQLRAIFIAHIHGDHTFGLPGLLTSASIPGRSIILTGLKGPGHPQSAPRFDKRGDGHASVFVIKQAVNHRTASVHFLCKLGLVNTRVPHRLLNLPNDNALQRLCLDLLKRTLTGRREWCRK
jgi:hypothetical protein